MYVIPDYKFCYLAAPRTGSKAVAKALVEKYGAVCIGNHHTTPDENLEYELGSDWIICSTVRNSWDTMISWWFKIERRGRMKPLSVFLPHFYQGWSDFVQRRQLWWKCLPYTNKTLRHHRLNVDLDQALVAAGLPPIDLPVVTDSKRGGRPYQIFYKGDTANWVAQYFKEENERYNFKF